jgi:hypothetical protein
VQPRLVLTLQLVVELDAVNPRPALGQALCCPFIGAIDLQVVFAFPFAFEAVPEGLTGAVVAVSLTLEQLASLFRQRHGMLTRSRHTNDLNQTLFAEVPQVA